MSDQPLETPAEVLERYAAAQPELQKCFDMGVNYFRSKCLDKTNLERRPPVSLCLRDPDHVFTLKPGFRQPQKRLGLDGIWVIEEYGQMDFDTIYIDCVSVIEMPPQDGRPVLRHQRACKLKLNEAGQLSWSSAGDGRGGPADARITGLSGTGPADSTAPDQR